MKNFEQMVELRHVAYDTGQPMSNRQAAFAKYNEILDAVVVEFLANIKEGASGTPTESN